MTLANTLLRKLAEWRPYSTRDTVEVTGPAGDWTAAVTASAVDVVGAKLWEVGLRRRAGEKLDAAALRGWGERVAARATGLLEPLRLLEVDPDHGTALLRSDKPGQRDDALNYYEVLLRGDGGATIRRYQATHQPDTRRQQVEFTLTHEALAKLVDDVTAAA